MGSDKHAEFKALAAIAGVFAIVYCLPVESLRFQGALIEAADLARWYAREHVLLCLVPAFFIAGAIGVFISRKAVMKYLGPAANKALSYGVAAVSGSILAVCSCTVLPLFGGIYTRGAGLGPAIAFLYSGPAINVLAIVLTARVLGWELGLARAVGAISFSVLAGAAMHWLFRKEERQRVAGGEGFVTPDDGGHARPLWQTALCFGSMILLLVAASRSCCEHPVPGAPGFVLKWRLVAAAALFFGWCLWRFMGIVLWKLALAATPVVLLAVLLPAAPMFAYGAGIVVVVALLRRGTVETREWLDETWTFVRQIAPLLLFGVLAAGFCLGSPGSTDAGIVPDRWIRASVGDSPAAFLSMIGVDPDGVNGGWVGLVWPLWTNFVASLVGALMYFATLTEVPIVRALVDSGMGQGPALALLLAGPALSLPSMLVINSILGPRKTLAYVGLVVTMATLTGMAYGWAVR